MYTTNELVYYHNNYYYYDYYYYKCSCCCTEHIWVLIPDMILVMLSEFVVDWVKHAFITKFNEIPSEVCMLLS